jgi:hypothetical protein
MRRARLHSVHRHEIRSLKEFAATDPDRLIGLPNDRGAEHWSAEQNDDAAAADQKARHNNDRKTEYKAERESAHAPFEAADDHWHVVLRVSPSATADEIRQAYRSQIKQSHPDRVHGMSSIFRELAEAETKRLNSAYEQALMSLRPFEDDFAGGSSSYTRH